MRVPGTHVARGPVSVQVKNVCVHVWACSWSMHVYGPDTLRVNHGDMGPGTPVRKAALTNLGNQGPETGSLGQILSRERLEKESRPARLGTWATSDSPLCLSTLCRKKRERGCKQGWGTDTRQYTDHTEDNACARGSTCVLVFNPFNSPRRSTSPVFQTRKLRG